MFVFNYIRRLNPNSYSYSDYTPSMEAILANAYKDGGGNSPFGEWIGDFTNSSTSTTNTVYTTPVNFSMIQVFGPLAPILRRSDAINNGLVPTMWCVALGGTVSVCVDNAYINNDYWFQASVAYTKVGAIQISPVTKYTMSGQYKAGYGCRYLIWGIRD